MLTGLRKQVQAAMAEVPVRRRPALRRSDAPDALLATDLPMIAEEADVRAFTETLTALGFCILPRNGWLLLDAPVPVPEYVFPKNMPGEAGCCLELLLRNPGRGDAALVIRAIVKAAEAGRQPFERLCDQLHAEFAACLRQHRSLPGDTLPYLCAACQHIYRA